MTNTTTAKNNLIAQFLLKISEKVESSELTFIRDQLQSVLYNYSVDESQLPRPTTNVLEVGACKSSN